MFLRALQVGGFRNLATATLEPGPRFNVFAGDNGQGKTNVIEAIYTVCALRSFRTSRLRDVIAIGGDKAYVKARLERGGLERIYELELSERSRKVTLDGKAARPLSKYFSDVHLVLFAPEDLMVPRGSPSERRRFLDRAVFARSKAFLATAQAYEKVLKNRNAVLRDENVPRARREELLSVYDEQLASYGAALIAARISYLDEIRDHFEHAFEAITASGLGAGIRYERADDVEAAADSSNLQDALREALQRSRARDFARGSTNVGPHRDDLIFELSGQKAATFASQGQLRALILAWKTSELELLTAAYGDPPALLLDDVSSELDPQRNEYLFAFLKQRPSQCFITTTHADYVLLAEDRRDFQVRGGVVQVRD